MKVSGKVGNGPVNKWLNFGVLYQCCDTDPDHGSRSLSGHWYDVPWRRYALSWVRHNNWALYTSAACNIYIGLSARTNGACKSRNRKDRELMRVGVLGNMGRQ